MTGKLPSFFKETIGAMLNLCLTVYFTCDSKVCTSSNVILYNSAIVYNSARKFNVSRFLQFFTKLDTVSKMQKFGISLKIAQIFILNCAVCTI